MTMTDYAQLFVFILHRLLVKLYGFANFVKQHLVPYEYASISLVVIEASTPPCPNFYSTKHSTPPDVTAITYTRTTTRPSPVNKI